LRASRVQGNSTSYRLGDDGAVEWYRDRRDKATTGSKVRWDEPPHSHPDGLVAVCSP
jgi:hypothetical protein